MGIKTGRFLDCLLVALFCVFMLMTMDLLPAIWGFLEFFMGTGVSYIPAWFIGLPMSLLFFYLVFMKKKRRLSPYVWFFIISGVLYIVYINIPDPYERMHLFEYFLLSIFSFKLFRHYVCTRRLYLVSFIFTIIIALIDENLQPLISTRSFGLLDIGSDFASAFLSHLSIALIIEPKLKVCEIKIRDRYKHFYAQRDWLVKKQFKNH